MEIVFNKEKIKATKDSIKEVVPFYGEILDFYEKIFIIQEELKLSLSPDPLILNEENLSYPLIKRKRFNIDSDSAGKVLNEILKVVKSENNTFVKFADKVENEILNDPVNFKNLIDYILNADEEFITIAEKIEIPNDTLYFFIYNSIKPFLEISSEQLSHYLKGEDYDGGICPICGGHPYLSVFNENGERSLICEFCCHQWKAKRIFCPFCDSQDKDKLKYFYSESEAFHRVDLCDDCKRFIKCVDLRKLERSFYPPFEMLSTLHLDMKAKELGYRNSI